MEEKTEVKENKKEMMSVAIKIVGIVALAGVFVVALLQERFLPAKKSVVISTEARVPFKFDTAVVNLGVVSLGAPTQEEALRITEEKIERIKGVLKEMGIADSDWEISGYAFDPNYHPKEGIVSEDVDTENEKVGKSNDELELKGYNSFQRITVRLKGIDQKEKLLSDFLRKMASEKVDKIGNVHFILSDIEKLKDQTEKLAIEKLKNKAVQWEKDMGVKFEGMENFNINEEQMPNTNYYSSYDVRDITFYNQTNKIEGENLSNLSQEAVLEVSANYLYR